MTVTITAFEASPKGRRPSNSNRACGCGCGEVDRIQRLTPHFVLVSQGAGISLTAGAVGGRERGSNRAGRTGLPRAIVLWHATNKRQSGKNHYRGQNVDPCLDVAWVVGMGNNRGSYRDCGH